MNVFEKHVDETIQKIKNLFNDDLEDYRLFFDKVRQDIERFKTTGSFNSTKNDDEELTSNNQTQALRASSKLSSRNTEMSANVAIKMERISESLLDHSDNLSDGVLSSRAIKNENKMPPPQLPVKRTKRTGLISETAHTRSTRSKAIKKEIISEVENKRNHKHSQLSQNPFIQEPHNRDSDIVLQKENILVLTLTDTDEEDLYENTNGDAKSTSSKTNKPVKDEKLSKNKIQMQNENPCDKLQDEGGESCSNTNLPSFQEKNTKRLCTPSTEDDKRKQRAKQVKKENRKKNILAAPQQELSYYEDCFSNPDNENCEQVVQVNDATFVTVPSSKQNGIESNFTITAQRVLNTTVGISKPTMNSTVVLDTPVLTVGTLATRNFNFDDLMTDDESINENSSPPKFQSKTKVTVKPIFSPFENSPVKKRVEAFEKLGADIVDNATVHVTRTKTKAKAQQAKEAEEQKEQEHETQLKGKAKLTPLMANRLLPFSAAVSTSKIPKHVMLLNNESGISIKYASTLKASQQEFRERELKRKEKVEQAKRKKEALLQAQSEEKKRRREEKQLKAQQVREANEKNKEKILQKLKDEKHKQLLTEKHQRQREESEKKRLQTMKKAIEEKRKDEEKKKAQDEDKLAAKLGYEKKAANDVGKKLPIYMAMKAPLLPTDECYDSDNSEVPNVNVRRPDWDRSENKDKVLLVMQFAGEKIKNTFFCRESKTPDLQDIFENIDPGKLKRTSSAIWRKPPRFTTLPISTSFNENED